MGKFALVTAVGDLTEYNISVPKKRTRSASTASDHQAPPAARPDTPVNGVQQPRPPAATTTTTTTIPKPSGRHKRGGRKPPPVEIVNQDGEEGMYSAI